MYEERGKTLPDGRIEVIVSDPSTGQEVVRYYSPGAEPKVSLADLVLKDGFLRDELMPPSVAKKDDLTPLATKEELRNATKGLLARSEVMDGDKIKSSLLPAPNVTAADGSSLLGSDGKIRHDLLPEGAGGSTEGGSVDLQPLEKRVAALENAPKGEGGGNSLGVYDKSVYTKVVNESELLSQLTSEQQERYKRLKRICRAAFCWRKLSGIETGQDTAEKIVLEDGTVFFRLTDGKLYSNVGGMFNVYSASFCNLSTLQKVDFFHVYFDGFTQYSVAQVDPGTEDLPILDLVGGRFAGRFFRLGDTDYTVEDASTGSTAAAAVKEKADEAKEKADGAKAAADNAKAAADGAKVAADKAKAAADGAKAAADKAKEVADAAKVAANQAYEYGTRVTELSFDVGALKSEMKDVKGSLPEQTRIAMVAQSAADDANHRLDDFTRTGFLVEASFEIENGKDPSLEEDGQVHENGLGNYLPRLFFHKVYGDVCVRVGSGVFKLLNKGLCFRFYRDESDSGLWHERQYYTFMDREVEVKVLDYRVDEDFRWKMVGEHLNTKSPQEQIKELLGLS